MASTRKCCVSKMTDGVEQIHGQSISKVVVELKDFNVATAGNDGAQQVTFFFTLLVIASPQC